MSTPTAIVERRYSPLRRMGNWFRLAWLQALGASAAGVSSINDQLSLHRWFRARWNSGREAAIIAAPEDYAIAASRPAAETLVPGESGIREVAAPEELDRPGDDARPGPAQLPRLSSVALEAREEERKRIARELHDDTAQALTSMLVRLRFLERSAGDEGLRDGLNELLGLTRDTLEGVRRLSADLRPGVLDELGLEDAIQAHVQDFSARWPVETTFTCGGVGSLPADVELALYRVVQEALANVGKHSSAARARVSVIRDGAQVLMTIEDDGSGFETLDGAGSQGTGLGLSGMDERLSLVGGVLRVDSNPGSGTRVTAQIPLPSNGLG